MITNDFSFAKFYLVIYLVLIVLLKILILDARSKLNKMKQMKLYKTKNNVINSLNIHVFSFLTIS